MIKIIFSAFFMILGVIVFIISAIGNFRFAFILNRMQTSANADTLATSCILIGLIIFQGFTALSLKLLIMLLFLWFANPVASHFLAKTEIIVNENIKDECEVVYHDDI